MKDLKINGTQKFMGIEIPVIEGGFGDGKKCLSDKTIAEIHEVRVLDIRQTINRNITRFKVGVDFMDLLIVNDGVVNNKIMLIELGYTNMMISKSSNIYLLSERGYAKLIKIMDSDLAWDIHDKLIDEYFTMREIINQQIPSYRITDELERAERWVEEEKERRLLQEQIKIDKPKVEKFDEFMSKDGTFGFRGLCKHLNSKGLNLKETTLRQYLVDNKITCKQGNKYVITEDGVRQGYGVLLDKIVGDKNRQETRYTDKLRDKILGDLK